MQNAEWTRLTKVHQGMCSHYDCNYYWQLLFRYIVISLLSTILYHITFKISHMISKCKRWWKVIRWEIKLWFAGEAPALPHISQTSQPSPLWSQSRLTTLTELTDLTFALTNIRIILIIIIYKIWDIMALIIIFMSIDKCSR